MSSTFSLSHSLRRESDSFQYSVCRYRRLSGVMNLSCFFFVFFYLLVKFPLEHEKERALLCIPVTQQSLSNKVISLCLQQCSSLITLPSCPSSICRCCTVCHIYCVILIHFYFLVKAFIQSCTAVGIIVSSRIFYSN